MISTWVSNRIPPQRRTETACRHLPAGGARLEQAGVYKTLSLKTGYGERRHPIGNEVSPLREWLPAFAANAASAEKAPATIIAARCRSHRKVYDFIGNLQQQNEWRCPVAAPFILVRMDPAGRTQKAGAG
jgi:hypothetical protein